MQLWKHLTTKIFRRVLKQLTHVTTMNLICDYCKVRINSKNCNNEKTELEGRGCLQLPTPCILQSGSRFLPSGHLTPIVLFLLQNTTQYCDVFHALLALSQMPSIPSPVPYFPDFCPLLSLTPQCSPPLTSLYRQRLCGSRKACVYDIHWSQHFVWVYILAVFFK